MFVRFLNGSAEQQQLFKDAMDEAWPRFASPTRVANPHFLAVQIDVTWGSESAPEHGSVTLSDIPSGKKALMSLDGSLEGSELQENVMHQLGHVALALQVNEAGIQTICNLCGKPRSAWDAGAWEDQVKEGAAELFKDGLAPATNREEENRTNIRLQLSGGTAVPPGSFDGQRRPVEWNSFCAQWLGSSNPVPIEEFNLPWRGYGPHEPKYGWSGNFGLFEGEFTGFDYHNIQNARFVSRLGEDPPGVGAGGVVGWVPKAEFSAIFARHRLEIRDAQGVVLGTNSLIAFPSTVSDPNYVGIEDVGFTLSGALAITAFQESRLPITVESSYSAAVKSATALEYLRARVRYASTSLPILSPAPPWPPAKIRMMTVD